MRYILIGFILLSLSASSQKIEVLNKSAFVHDYVLGSFEYIEDIRDTARLKYIATLRVNIIKNSISIISTLDRLKTKSKDLGANCYYLFSQEIKDSTITLVIKSYFAYDNFFELNKSKRKKDTIYIFGSVEIPNAYQYFYINDSSKMFLSTCFYQFVPENDKNYNIKACRKSPIHTTYNYVKIKKKKNKDSSFIVLYSASLVDKEKVSNNELPKKEACGNKLVGYSSSRILLEIYKPSNSSP